MKKSFAARRLPRKVGMEEDEDEPQGPIVKRPPLASKNKKTSKSRLSFGPGTSNDEPGAEDGDVFVPKKSNLSRVAIEKNAERKGLRPSVSSEQINFRTGLSEDRPSYSKDSLAELKSSTYSTPRNVSSDEETQKPEIDIAAKFGALARITSDSAIPTEAEIREKKERRARLAKEQQYLSLDTGSDDDERNEISFRPKEKWGESRLVLDDEDIAEGFDDFTEDGKISLGRKAEKEQTRRRRAEMADLIADAEKDSSEESDDSEAERNAAYEAAQTRAGTYGTRPQDEDLKRPKTPPKITPIPELKSVLERLRASLRVMEELKAVKVRKLEELRTEKNEISEREVWIQNQLKETAERYERLRVEAGIGRGTLHGIGSDADGKITVNRGLESFGTTPAVNSDVSDG
ncbi:hypothetical protein M501DRAFT_987304 [Patellaria atrata CBS 101060]|uniref:Nineteen complex-related protein 2-domain-containing protein n=1 Tax=Patellaria atrata CBS 101060 TaxID=1346257 RepID=A0A9P4S7B4_9PEZI|nr:hypothetical protein M501DRAFT_987304 [Patellaria atrata CBS 101060]